MKTATFNKILIAVLALCILLTAAHVVYAVWAYQHCSIIYFIGKELW
ncbi:MAG: hypothetical protein IIX44_02990 [Clostridia bacterium]|nr:hypothetical protein [Clostridia bacterium]